MAEEKKDKQRRGRYYVAGVCNKESCQNTSFTDGVRMHQFPTDPVVRAQWVNFVRKHRHNFKDPTSKYASLCSVHFEESCYERNLSVPASMAQQGIKMNANLRKDAVPTRDTVNPPVPEGLRQRTKRKGRHFSQMLISVFMYM